MKAISILIVDDDELFAETIRTALEDHGEIDVANNGQVAMLQLEKRKYDVILSDIDMPIMDGFTFYVVATQSYPNTIGRFLFVTGNACGERLVFFKKHDVAYLQKPFHLQELLDAIKKLLQ